MPAICLVLMCTLLSPLSGQEDHIVYKAGNGVSAPRLIKDVKPQYSADAMRRGVKGAVLLRCVVDRDGVPTHVEVLQPLDDSLDRISVATLRQWRFEPGRKNGEAVPVQLDVAFAFTIIPPKARLWRRILRGIAG